MSATNVPARAPEPQPSNEHNASRPVAWPREKKTTRFTIKIGGVIPG